MIWEKGDDGLICITTAEYNALRLDQHRAAEASTAAQAGAKHLRRLLCESRAETARLRGELDTLVVYVAELAGDRGVVVGAA